jgi:hypothetical protein
MQFSVIYEDDLESVYQHNVLLDLTHTATMCATSYKLPSLSTAYAHQSILNRILVTGNTGVVYIGRRSAYLEMVAYFESHEQAGDLQWLVLTTDAPLTNEYLAQSVYNRGILTIQLLPRQIPEFENFWVTIDPDNPPWYDSWYIKNGTC